MAALGLARVFAEIAQDVRHAFVSTQTQSVDTSIVSKNEWNAAHSAPDVEIGAMPGLYMASVSAGTTEGWGETGGENRWQKRLLQAGTFRIQASVTEALIGGALILQYTTDLTGASGWTTMGGSVSLAATGNVVSSWVTVPAGAQGSGGVLMRWAITL